MPNGQERNGGEARDRPDRSELSETIQALEERVGETRESVVDKVSPSRIWQRKTAGIRSRFDDLGATVAASRQAVAGSSPAPGPR